jgi:hypothetical protein
MSSSLRSFHKLHERVRFHPASYNHLSILRQFRASRLLLLLLKTTEYFQTSTNPQQLLPHQTRQHNSIPHPRPNQAAPWRRRTYPSNTNTTLQANPPPDNSHNIRPRHPRPRSPLPLLDLRRIRRHFRRRPSHGQRRRARQRAPAQAHR